MSRALADDPRDVARAVAGPVSVTIRWMWVMP